MLGLYIVLPYFLMLSVLMTVILCDGRRRMTLPYVIYMYTVSCKNTNYRLFVIVPSSVDWFQNSVTVTFNRKLAGKWSV